MRKLCSASFELVTENSQNHNVKGECAILLLRILKYSKNREIRTLNFEGQVAVGSYLMITNSNIRLFGS